MSVFTDAEIEYLRSQRLGRLATVGADGQPHVIPITFLYNEDEDATDLAAWTSARAREEARLARS